MKAYYSLAESQVEQGSLSFCPEYQSPTSLQTDTQPSRSRCHKCVGGRPVRGPRTWGGPDSSSLGTRAE